jgi:hypothetical protein
MCYNLITDSLPQDCCRADHIATSVPCVRRVTGNHLSVGSVIERYHIVTP